MLYFASCLNISSFYMSELAASPASNASSPASASSSSAGHQSALMEHKRAPWYELVSGPSSMFLSGSILGRAYALPSFPLVPDVAVRHRGDKVADYSNFLTENCVGKVLMASIGGGGMGLMMGAVMAGFSSNAMNYQPVEGVKMGQAFREGLVAMKRSAISQGKTFALIGGLITTIECPIEQYRGRHDMKNAVLGGSITGAVLASRAGPKAMVLGAVGFAAFGMVMDTFFRDLLGG